MMFTECLVRPPDFCVHQIFLYCNYPLQRQRNIRLEQDGSHLLGVRAAVDVDDEGIALGLREVGGEVEPHLGGGH